MEFDFGYVFTVLKDLFPYLRYTILMAVLGTIFAFIFASVLTTVRLLEIKGLKTVVMLYVSFFRSTPLLVQLSLFYFGLPQIIPPIKNMHPLSIMVISLTFCGSAYISEIIRGSFLSVDKGQTEAGLSIGMSKLQVIRRIIFPQAMISAVPGIGNVFVDLLKSASFSYIIGFTEILARARMSAAASFKILESYLALAIMYWITVELFNKVQKIIEKKIFKAYR